MPKVSDEYFEQKRKEIVDAAYRVCMKKPITSVEMKDIIAETGFSHGVIYRYYSELDEVLQDLMIRTGDREVYAKVLEPEGTGYRIGFTQGSLT